MWQSTSKTGVKMGRPAMYFKNIGILNSANDTEVSEKWRYLMLKHGLTSKSGQMWIEHQSRLRLFTATRSSCFGKINPGRLHKRSYSCPPVASIRMRSRRNTMDTDTGSPGSPSLERKGLYANTQSMASTLRDGDALKSSFARSALRMALSNNASSHQEDFQKSRAKGISMAFLFKLRTKATELKNRLRQKRCRSCHLLPSDRFTMLEELQKYFDPLSLAEKIAKKQEERKQRELERKMRFYSTRKLRRDESVERQDVKNELQLIKNSDPSNPYTPQNLLRRESLKFDTRLRKIVQTFWRLLRIKNGKLTHDKYIEFSVLLQKAVIPKETFTRNTAYQTAEEDWKSDCQGYEYLDWNRFCNALFQAADTWTERISSDAYCTFLKHVLKKITREQMIEYGQVQLVYKSKYFQIKPRKASKKDFSAAETALQKSREFYLSLKSQPEQPLSSFVETSGFISSSENIDAGVKAPGTWEALPKELRTEQSGGMFNSNGPTKKPISQLVSGKMYPAPSPPQSENYEWAQPNLYRGLEWRTTNAPGLNSSVKRPASPFETVQRLARTSDINSKHELYEACTRARKPTTVAKSPRFKANGRRMHPLLRCVDEKEGQRLQKTSDNQKGRCESDAWTSVGPEQSDNRFGELILHDESSLWDEVPLPISRSRNPVANDKLRQLRQGTSGPRKGARKSIAQAITPRNLNKFEETKLCQKSQLMAFPSMQSRTECSAQQTIFSDPTHTTKFQKSIDSLGINSTIPPKNSTADLELMISENNYNIHEVSHTVATKLVLQAKDETVFVQPSAVENNKRETVDVLGLGRRICKQEDKTAVKKRHSASGTATAPERRFVCEPTRTICPHDRKTKNQRPLSSPGTAQRKQNNTLDMRPKSALPFQRAFYYNKTTNSEPLQASLGRNMQLSQLIQKSGLYEKDKQKMIKLINSRCEWNEVSSAVLGTMNIM